MTKRSAKPFFTVCATAVACGMLSTLIGCATSAPPPSFSEAAFSGPAVSLDSSGRHHVAVIQAPSPGWEATLTRVMPGPKHRAAFITLRKPFPGVLYAQVIVTQRVSTDIPSTEPIRVYARVIEYDAPANSDASFQLAAANQAASIAPEPSK